MNRSLSLAERSVTVTPSSAKNSANDTVTDQVGRGFTSASTSMDIARPDLARRNRRRRWVTALLTALALGGVTYGLSCLEPAAPKVENPWLDTVKRGEMLRQVRGNGTLVPEQIQYVQAEIGGLVERIFMQPGAAVQADTIILELGNPDLKQAAFEAEFAIKSAEAQLIKLTVQLESDRLNQEALLATLKSDAHQASLEAEANEILARDGLVPRIEQKRTRAKATDLAAHVIIDQKRLEFASQTTQSQLAVQTAEVEKLRAQLELKRRQVAALTVRAGIDGVLTQVGDKETLQTGQRVAASATLAKVVVPTRLKAELKVAETQVRDVALGQSVAVDTRNGIVPGHVVRVDPAALNGTVVVEVKLDGPLPKGARPDLSVEGTIELERLTDVLYMGRPVQVQPESTVGLFRVTADGKHALRTPVKLGRASVSSIEIVEGLQAGDQVILSDMSQSDAYHKVRLN